VQFVVHAAAHQRRYSFRSFYATPSSFGVRWFQRHKKEMRSSVFSKTSKRRKSGLLHGLSMLSEQNGAYPRVTSFAFMCGSRIRA
jgi:hypothetical protein